METITARSMSESNSFANPTAISRQTKTIKAGSDFVVVFPEHSISVIALKVLAPVSSIWVEKTKPRP
jgi:alpha-L-arabinofuranosidase